MGVPETMRAAVLTGPNRLEVREVPTPRPGPQDVLIRVDSCALCGSDVSLMAEPWAGQPPYGEFIPGHEYSGVVAAVGDTVDEYPVGTRVAVEAHYGCGRCLNCRRGDYTSCLNYGNRAKGHRANGFTTNGGYAEYVANHINTVHAVPDAISLEEASLVTNAGCVLYGFETLGGFVAGETVVVIGPGPVGLMAVQVASALAADQVVLLVNRGEYGASYVMPDLIGVSGDRATLVLRGQGFRVAVVASAPYPGIAAGIVLRQNPQAGFQIAPGEPISIEVSR